MSNFSPDIFLSYCWKNEDLADELDNTFTEVGLYIQRDKRDLKYKENLQSFMQRIAKSDYVLMLLSDEYLRRTNCMYEVIELLNTHELNKKILPVLHENVLGIFNQDGRKIYYDYWQDQILKTKEILDEHTNDDSLEEWKKSKSIYENLGSFFQQIKYLKAETFKELKEKNYKPIYDIVGFDESRIIEEAIRIHNIESAEERDLELESFAKKHLNNKYSLFTQAYYESKQKHYKKARFHYEELIKRYPNHFLAWNNLGVILQHEFLDYKEAKEKYEKAIELNPAYFDAHSNLAILLHNQATDSDLSRRHYEIALKIRPNDEVLHYNLAVLIGDKFLEFEQAEKHYRYAIYLKDDFAEAYYNLSLLLKNQFSESEYENAKKYYTTAINLKPELKHSDLDDFFHIT